jgi:hypothetical protein
MPVSSVPNWLLAMLIGCDVVRAAAGRANIDKLAPHDLMCRQRSARDRAGFCGVNRFFQGRIRRKILPWRLLITYRDRPPRLCRV